MPAAFLDHGQKAQELHWCEEACLKVVYKNRARNAHCSELQQPTVASDGCVAVDASSQ
jgi:hypothetical protein